MLYYVDIYDIVRESYSRSSFTNFARAIEFAEQRNSVYGPEAAIFIVDECGRLIGWQCDVEDEQSSSRWEDEDGCDYEVGYDPYMGCFTDDC